MRSYKLKQNNSDRSKPTNSLYSSKNLTKEVGLIAGMGDIMFYIGEDVRWLNLIGYEIDYVGAIALKILGD